MTFVSGYELGKANTHTHTYTCRCLQMLIWMKRHTFTKTQLQRIIRFETQHWCYRNSQCSPCSTFNFATSLLCNLQKIITFIFENQQRNSARNIPLLIWLLHYRIAIYYICLNGEMANKRLLEALCWRVCMCALYHNFCM